MCGQNDYYKKRQIKEALLDFKNNDLYSNSMKFFKTLGYNTQKTYRLNRNDYLGFKYEYDIGDNSFNEDKALVSDWTKVEFLFQLTEEEIKEQVNNFTTKKTNMREINSYLFFSIELRDENYTKAQLSNITRQINKLFAIPVFIIFKYGYYITLAIIYRRKNKLNEDRDILKKVTLIKDINYQNPHRAHIDILLNLTLERINDKYFPKSFIELDNAFRKVLSSSELNINFYKDITKWYYYATKTVKLTSKPTYIKDEKEYNKMFVVRLLTRLIFCWFLKEKGLIDRELLELNINKYKKILKCMNREDFIESNSYYKGILQNIFFRALSQENKKSKDDFNWTEYLSDDFDYNKLINIPYLNGGIFNMGEDEPRAIYVPNYLFFGGEVEGINAILDKYKFTIEENTPLEEDIALDPELLGMVFENLLAEIDPNLDNSTVNSIRRQTGSYYTPRKVIGEMVNESLFLYLNKYFAKYHSAISKYKVKIHTLIYYDKVEISDREFCRAIIDALDNIKVLDPACGSGAFPMGILQKIVHILNIVDPDNQIWLKKQLSKKDISYKHDFKEYTKYHLNDYIRKLSIIKNSIYGVDIQPLAVQITKLRFFISLLIEQNVDRKKKNFGIKPMPNLETKIICANSLRDVKENLLDANIIQKLIQARREYYEANHNYRLKEKIADKISTVLNQGFPNFTKEIFGKQLNEDQNKKILKEWFIHSNLAAPFFKLKFFFPEVHNSGGFDIIIGNPPYGGMKIDNEIQKELDLGSKDIYGAFIARFLGDGKTITPLKSGGILAYIVSDTFMTIKTHKKLRQKIIQNKIHKMIRTSADTFRATVNTVIIICEKVVNKPIPDDHKCQMVDMTNISFHKNYDKFVEVLHKTTKLNNLVSESNEEYAIYYYPQNLIKINSNLPFFVASPKLFTLMNDKGKTEKEWIQIGNIKTQARIVNMNGKRVKLVKLQQIAEVKQGLATGDNKAYLFKHPDVKGNYRSIEDFKQYILTDEDLEKIRTNEKLRISIIEKGISKYNKKSNRYFGGRYIIPYDKGGESFAENGWLPNYYVPTDYYIDWSEWAVNRMKTLTIRDRDSKGKNQICSVLRNKSTYFQDSITSSRVGMYSPTFRYGSNTIYDSGCSNIFSIIEVDILIAILNSKIYKYLFKTTINHTVNSQVKDNLQMPIPSYLDKSIKMVVKKVVSKQKRVLKYDYASHEQILIDKLVYEAYGLNEEDIREVENWYARRDPKLNEAQKKKQEKLGLSKEGNVS